MVKPRTNYIASLDIGNNKIICLIAEVKSNGELNVIGIGHNESAGIKSGTIVNIQKAEIAIRAAVSAAEQMAGINVDKIIVNISGAKQKSHLVSVEVPITQGQEINSKDINRLIEEACKYVAQENIEIVHCIPIEYMIDNNPGITDPTGMFGTVLSANLHIITACSSVIHNLTNCLAKCHLDVEYYVSSPLASGYSCLKEDEKLLGCILIEFGGGNTTLSYFKNGHIVHMDTIALGGSHITNDIALGISTHINGAERIKTLYGSLFNSTNDENDLINVPVMDSENTDSTNQIERAILFDIILPRVEEILEAIKDNIDHSSLAKTGKTIIITGGASQLSGLKEFVAHYLNKQVRIGIPPKLNGLNDNIKGPAFATSIGMLQYSLDKLIAENKDNPKSPYFVKNSINSLSRWFKENF